MQLLTEFSNWLKENTSLSDSSIEHYERGFRAASKDLIDSKDLVERINSAIDTLLGIKAILTGIDSTTSSDNTDFDDMFDFLK